MQKFIISIAVIGLSMTASAVNQPRQEFEGDPPTYEVSCPESAIDAKDCEIDTTVYTGWRTYKIECQQCHGGGGMGSTFAPNLMDRINKEGVDYGRFLYVMDNGYTGQMGVMPALKANPRVQKNKAAIYAYLQARAAGVLPKGRPPKPAQK